ncbi:DUF3006 family protein [Halorhabdus rudnickae]|uniref:DUF3006 family protein n=1 Tax=Halorhabdus rudnickae TaxID=1775544 RepID=UPI001083A253|nr:DUF3006 family protein [Halorhabdus rudnickae]
MNGTYTAVVDEIVDGETAVLLVEDQGGDEIIKQLDVDVGSLPDGCNEEGVVCEAVLEDGELINIDRRDEETTRRREDIQERVDRLSKSLSDE